MSECVMTFDEAAEYLDALADALPEGIMRELNGGISLIPDVRDGGRNGLSTLGMYFANGPMGRYIELYYGSFERLFGGCTREKFERELKKTLYHELTHHIESLAGDRSLEIEDELFMEDFEAEENGEPLNVDSVLFASSKGADLPAVAAAVFRKKCRDTGADIRCACAVFGTEELLPVSENAKKAAAALGADAECEVPVRLTKEMMWDYDAVFCLTEEEADDLADDYPHRDSRIFALGERDIAAPKTALGWGRCARQIEEGVDLLLNDLFADEKQRF